MGHCICKQGLQSPMENQAKIKKLTIETQTDSNRNDPGMNNGTTTQTYGFGIPPKETTAIMKKRSKILVEVKAENYYILRTKANFFGRIHEKGCNSYVLSTWEG